MVHSGAMAGSNTAPGPQAMPSGEMGPSHALPWPNNVADEQLQKLAHQLLNLTGAGQNQLVTALGTAGCCER